MTTPTIETWYYVQIVLKSLVDGSTTKTVKLSNRPMIDEADGSTIYFPILKQLNNIGSQMGDYIPNRVSGSIVLDNSPSSFGFDRKFSDLLERYTILGQPVTIYSAYTTLDDTTINAEFALDWTTTGLTWEIRGDDLIIQVAEQSLPLHVVSKLIDASTYVGAASPATESYGKYLPMIFGDNVPVKAIPFNYTATNEDVRYAWGASFGSNFLNSGPTAYYAKDHTGTYQNITNPASSSTALFQSTCSGGSSAVLTNSSYGYTLGAASSTCYILRGGKIKLNGASVGGTPTGKLEFKLVEASAASTGPDESSTVASASVNKSDYTSGYNGSSDFFVEFSFNKPAVMRANVAYILLVSGSDEVAYPSAIIVGAGGFGQWVKPNGTTGMGWNVSGATNGTTMEFYGVRFSGTGVNVSSIDSSGIGATSTLLSQKTAATGQTNPDLNKLDLVFVVSGITDDVSGTITGSASARVLAPQHVLKALDLRYDGSSWTTTGSQIDATRFSTAIAAHGETSSSSTTKPYPRQISGFSEGRKTAADLMREVCRNSAFRIGRYNGSSKPFTLWAWGDTQQAAAVITDEDSQLLTCKTLGAETVINRALMNYNKDLRYSDPPGQGSLKNYASNIVADGAGATYGNYSSGLSIALYGRRELGDNAFEYISTNLSNFAAAMAQFYLRVYPFPFVYAELEVPMFKYRTLEIFDVIEIVHPGLPSYFGSTSNARLPYYSGAVTDLCAGQYWKRGKRYRAQIEGKTLNYNLSGFPTIKLNCRLLLNTGIDPT